MVSAQTASESVISKVALMSFPGKGVTVDRDGKWNKETLNHRYRVSFHVWDLATGETGKRRLLGSRKQVREEGIHEMVMEGIAIGGSLYSHENVTRPVVLFTYTS